MNEITIRFNKPTAFDPSIDYSNGYVQVVIPRLEKEGLSQAYPFTLKLLLDDHTGESYFKLVFDFKTSVTNRDVAVISFVRGILNGAFKDKWGLPLTTSVSGKTVIFAYLFHSTYPT